MRPIDQRKGGTALGWRHHGLIAQLSFFVHYDDSRFSPESGVTFAKATDLYISFKQPSKGNERRIRRISAAIGPEKLVDDVHHADLGVGATKSGASRQALHGRA